VRSIEHRERQVQRLARDQEHNRRRSSVVLGARLKKLRIRNRQSLQQVADAVKVSKAHIWELETGKSRNPSMELLGRLADHYKVTVAYLVGEDPSAANEDPSLITMFRELKGLTENDRETVRAVIESLKERARKHSR
jgi:transcriptional regulator with XRE-family HTH domain